MTQAKNTLLITGAAGFIGSTFVRLRAAEGYDCIVLDALTYAGFRGNIEPDEVQGPGSVTLVEGDIRNADLVRQILQKYPVAGIFNFAAETHVDRSIEGPKAFIETNINGTFTLLNEALTYWSGLPDESEIKGQFRYLQVSTDEVYGTLGEVGKFNELSPYLPRSPYAASKAAADHLVRAWYHTYGLPTLVTTCSNNYGPRQYPEKLIPLMIRCALQGAPLPVYGNGGNIRDWIHVEDHCEGVWLAYQKGHIGQTYGFGGDAERSNIEVVQMICQILDEHHPRPDGKSYIEQITFVKDRLAHDWRYATDDRKAHRELGFTRKTSSFEAGLQKTVQWYLENQVWVERVLVQSRVL